MATKKLDCFDAATTGCIHAHGSSHAGGLASYAATLAALTLPHTFAAASTRANAAVALTPSAPSANAATAATVGAAAAVAADALLVDALHGHRRSSGRMPQ